MEISTRLLIRMLLTLTLAVATESSNYYKDFDLSWGGEDGKAKILNNGETLSLSLDQYSGSGFQSKNEYLYGKIDMQLKLVPGNSAGTVTAYYLSSEGSDHDEIDFEFLGNLSGEPYTVHTNVYTQGQGGREQQFRLWFDPTADFHTYSLLWNPQTIVFSADNIPLREFKNLEMEGVSFPKSKPMRLYSSIWNADEWATRGGLIKTDWSQAPFTALYRNFKQDACVVVSNIDNYSDGSSLPGTCSSQHEQDDPAEDRAWLSRKKLDPNSEEKLKWVQQNYMIYDYCVDTKRHPQGMPPECRKLRVE